MTKKYEFETEPYQHQLDGLRKAYGKPGFAYFFDMGAGKSKTALDEACALYEQGEIEAVLIMAPKGNYHEWENQIAIHVPKRIETSVCRWQTTKSGDFWEWYDLDHSEKMVFVIVNIESVPLKKGQECVLKTLERWKCFWVVDESTTIKSHSAKRTKLLCRLRYRAKYRRILSGLPTPQNVLDLYSQLDFLDPDIIGIKSYYGFQGRYAITKPMRSGNKTFQKVVGVKERLLPELFAKMDPYMHRVRKKDCLDLPDKVFSVFEVELSKEQKQAYDDMKEFLMVMTDSGEATTETALAQLIRLHQITCGFLPMDDGTIKDFKHGRVDAMMHILEECPRNVIVWCHYVHMIPKLRDAIAKKYGDESVVMYYGATKDQERLDAVRRFQDPEDPLQFIVGNRAMAYGLNLTAGQTNIYYTNDWNLEIRSQSEDRTHRIGQHNSVNYVDLVSPGTIDRVILGVLKSKRNFADFVMTADWRELV